MTDKPAKLSIKGIETEVVQNYLNQYPFLKPVLQEAEVQIIQYFGEDAEVVYRVIHDPEIANWIRLFGYIWTDLPIDEALEKLDKFDEAWYSDLSFDIRDKLNFQIR